MKIKNSQVIYLGITVMLFPVFFGSILSSLFRTNIVNSLFTYVGFLIILYCYLILYGFRMQKKIFLFFSEWLILIPFIVINNGDLIHHNWQKTFITLTSILCGLLLGQMYWKISKVVKIIVTYGYVHVIATLLFFINSKLYNFLIIPLYGNNINGTNGGRYGYKAGLFLNYSTNGNIIALVVVFLGADILTNYFTYSMKRYSKNIMFIFALVALLLTTKRAQLVISLFILFIVLIYYMVINGKIKQMIKMLKSLLFLFVVFFTMYIINPDMFAVFSRFKAVESDIRFTLWKWAWNDLVNSPVYGYGWNSFQYRYRNLLPEMMNAHNTYYELLSDVGIVGFTIFMIAISKGMSFTIHMLLCKKTNCLNYDYKLCLIPLLCIQIYFILYSFTGTPYHDDLFIIFILTYSYEAKIYRDNTLIR